jgi:hypothetical protein
MRVIFYILYFQIQFRVNKKNTPLSVAMQETPALKQFEIYPPMGNSQSLPRASPLSVDTEEPNRL